MYFKDRKDAGRQLAEQLLQYRRGKAIVYALPRGGVILGYEIAKELELPLDLVITRKIGHPISPEYAIAAVAENGTSFVNEKEVANIDKNWFLQEVEKQKAEAKRRRERYLKGRKPLSAKDKIAIIVDDGIATGLTMKVAIRELQYQKPQQIIVAVPVAPPETVEEISKMADRVVCIYMPQGPFSAVGQYYQYFPQVSDDEVTMLMDQETS